MNVSELNLRNIITQKRKSLGLSQREIAKSVGVTRQTVVRWERGKTKIPATHLLKILDILALKYREVFKLAQYPFNEENNENKDANQHD